MSDEGSTQRQREAEDAQNVRLHQILGFEITLDELEDLAEDAPDERAAGLAQVIVDAADNGSLDEVERTLADDEKAILREAHETGGEPTDELRAGDSGLSTEEEEGVARLEEIMLARQELLSLPPDMRPISEATGARIAYALEVLASAARPDIFETQEAQQDDLAARCGEFGLEVRWPEGKTFAEAAEAGEVSVSGPAVAKGHE